MYVSQIAQKRNKSANRKLHFSDSRTQRQRVSDCGHRTGYLRTFYLGKKPLTVTKIQLAKLKHYKGPKLAVVQYKLVLTRLFSESGILRRRKNQPNYGHTAVLLDKKVLQREKLAADWTARLETHRNSIRTTVLLYRCDYNKSIGAPILICARK